MTGGRPFSVDPDLCIGSKMSGKFITFEGCEGCGKSTQVRLLKEYLEKTGIPFICAREPGGTAISEKIREMILDSANSSIVDECEALLYAASRNQLIKEVIIPALEEGKLVILDRYIDSSMAYQAYGRGLGYDFVAKANEYALKNCMPDLTIFMDVEPEKAFRRKGGADVGDRLETAGMEFHERVYKGYKEMEKRFPERIVSFKTEGTKYETNALIVKYLQDRRFIG